MRVAAVQLNVVLADVPTNLAACESLAREAAHAGAQTIVLPEFFTTGAAFVAELADAALAPGEGGAASDASAGGGDGAAVRFYDGADDC